VLACATNESACATSCTPYIDPYIVVIHINNTSAPLPSRENWKKTKKTTDAVLSEVEGFHRLRGFGQDYRIKADLRAAEQNNGK
ncbi:MAG: hypothetical protein ACYTFQ_23770, partial [Planctomycetota bacterium]